VCVPNTTQCSGNAVQTCQSNGQWGSSVSCPSTCVSGACAHACAVGGCNSAGGACTASGQTCYCINDSNCKSKCVKTTGQNDVACASSCTGTGAADGFGCALVAPGIPAACGASFGYTPSNFAPGSYTPPTTGTTINCNTTYSSTTHAFTGWCTGQTAPTIYPSVAQSGGPTIDILAFSGLTLNSGNTLTLTGSNPIILAVYGNAAISGVIDASAQGTTPGAGATACAVGASGGGAAGPAYTAGVDAGAAGGGGGGLAVAGGYGDTSSFPGGTVAVAGTNINMAAGGGAHGNSTAVPLVGGCPGGTGAAGTASDPGGAAGVGGGGVQLSVAGTLSGTGTIKTNGSAGAAGTTEPTPTAHSDGAGGGGGGSAGDILIESPNGNTTSLQANGGAGGGGSTGYGTDTTSANTFPGFPGGAAGTNNGTTTATPANGGPPAVRGQNYTGGGGGGGGAYGWTKVNTGAAATFVCTTSLSPGPVCNAGHTACLCVSDVDCATGKCSNVSSQCTGTCTGTTTSGTYDLSDCQVLTSQ
jgi:hypothetical protein